MVHGHIALVLELIDIGIDHNANLDVSGCKHHLDFEKLFDCLKIFKNILKD